MFNNIPPFCFFVTYLKKYLYTSFFGSENNEIYAHVHFSADWFDLIDDLHRVCCYRP